MNSRTNWLIRSAAVAGAPLISGCLPIVGGGNCPVIKDLPWDGGLADGGVPGQDLDGGLDFQTCEANGCYGECTPIDAGVIQCTTYCVGGRAPPGLKGLSGVDGSTGSWLSRMAELEQAAVRAFMHLSRELDAHGLPKHAAYALEAAQHEVRHARAVTKLALDRGFLPRLAPIDETPLRSLEEVALDNAAEGCGREAFGAVVNAHQARAAEPDIAAAFAPIAREEAQHARFSMELARALMPKLSSAQRHRVREAQERALSQLGENTLAPAARRALGLFDEAQSRSAARALLETARV
jgi:hypothetical protein